MDASDAFVGGFSSVCCPVAGSHLSEKLDHGTKAVWKPFVCGILKVALNVPNWQRYGLMCVSQKATLLSRTRRDSRFELADCVER